MNLTGRKAAPKNYHGTRAERNREGKKAIVIAKRRSARIDPNTGEERFVCRISGKLHKPGDPNFHGAHLLSGRWNNSSRRWNPNQPDFILPMGARVHAAYDQLAPETRAEFLQDAAGAALRDGRTIDAMELYIYADIVKWLTDMRIEERPEFAE